jgi:NhaC family Na+:H+ antiporter
MALMLGGIMESCGFLEVLLARLLKFVKGATGLVGSVLASCVFANIFLADQYLSIVITGRMFKPSFDSIEFEGRKLDPAILSRSLEDSGTLTSVLIPWNTCGAYNSGVLGVSTVGYLPYAFLNYLNPIVALVMTRLGIGLKWVSPSESKSEAV